MNNDTYQIYTLNQRPDLTGQINQISREAWPEFLLHSDIEKAVIR